MNIRPLTAAELPSALTLSSTAGWNQQLDDWQMLVSLAPHGSIAAVDANRIVGTAIGIDYGGFGWIAMMLVDPAYRGQGLGRGLLEAAMAAIPSDRTIRLDATPLGRPLYERYGFVHETNLSRNVAQGGRGDLDAAASLDVHPMTGEALTAIAAQDVLCFGGRRKDVLAWAWERAPEYAYFVPDSRGFHHYCFGRRGRLFDQIGPVVTDDDGVARGLVSAALRATTDRPVAIDAFDSRVEFSGWLRDRGFRIERPLFRMSKMSGSGSRAARGRRPDLPTEFAIFGPEFG